MYLILKEDSTYKYIYLLVMFMRMMPKVFDYKFILYREEIHDDGEELDAMNLT